MQKENLFFFSFPNASDFGQAKVTKELKRFVFQFFIILNRDCSRSYSVLSEMSASLYRP